ncbi:MAG: ribbon-helix-helix domain-containing protein [Patescibacteria group bacterium]
MQTTISLPNNLAKEVDIQVKKGDFKTPSDFVNSAVKIFLSLQRGQATWETLAAPFRFYAKQKKLTEKDILQAVMKGRRAKPSKNS